VETRHNHRVVTSNPEEDPVGEPLQQSPPQVTVNHGETLGLPSDYFQDRADRLQELLAQARPSSLIPAVGVFDIRGGGRADSQGGTHSSSPPDLPQDLVPGNALAAIVRHFFQAPVEFRLLPGCEWHGFGLLRQAVPDLLDQFQAFLGSQAGEVKLSLWHTRTVFHLLP